MSNLDGIIVKFATDNLYKDMPIKKKIIRATTVPTSLETFCKDMLRELSATYDVLAVSSPGADLELVGQREGVRTEAVFMERRIAPLADVKSLFRLICLMRRERPWMVHSMTPKAGLLCMLAARIARVPVRIHTFTGLIWPTATGIKRKVLMATDRILCACATHLIPEGQGVKRDIENARLTRKPLRVLANGNVRGIDLGHYDRNAYVMSEASKIRKQGKLTFVFVGRLVGDKGINELVEAFLRLKSEVHDIRLLLVGRAEPELDPLKPDVWQAIMQDSDIEAVGEQHDVRPWFAASDVLAFPSYREGFPNVVIEAGAMGLPSIVTDINGANEIIIDGENGVIVPPRDADLLYRAMKEMYYDRERRERMAGNSRRLVADRYDCRIVRNALYDFYASLA